MKLIILRNDCNEQVLPISEGITETRANLNLARVITWQHDTRGPEGHHGWQQFTTRSKSRAGSYLALVPSSTRMPQRTHRGWPDTIPYHIHKEVRYRPTRWHMKLLSLRHLIKSRMHQYTTQTCSSGLDDRSLTDTGGGYHLEALNFRSDHLSSFPSSILPFPLIAPPHYANHLIILLNHIGPPSIERALSWVGSNHMSSTNSLHN
jgi:hypothetical protein